MLTANPSILLISRRKMVKQPDKHQSLRRASEAVKLLHSMFERGEVSAKSDLISVYESNPIFVRTIVLIRFVLAWMGSRKSFRILVVCLHPLHLNVFCFYDYADTLIGDTESEVDQSDVKVTPSLVGYTRKKRKVADVSELDAVLGDDDNGAGL